MVKYVKSSNFFSRNFERSTTSVTTEAVINPRISCYTKSRPADHHEVSDQSDSFQSSCMLLKVTIPSLKNNFSSSSFKRKQNNRRNPNNHKQNLSAFLHTAYHCPFKPIQRQSLILFYNSNSHIMHFKAIHSIRNTLHKENQKKKLFIRGLQAV